MNITLPLLLSVGAMLCWGVLYIFTTKLSRKVDPFVTLFLFQFTSILMLLPLSPFIHQPIDAKGVSSIVFLGGVGGLIWILFLYATKIGSVPVVIPVTNISIPLAALLGIIFLHESFSIYKGISIILVLLGVILISFDFKALRVLQKKFVFRGVTPAFFAGLGMGTYSLFSTFLTRQYGWYNSSILIRVGIIALALAVIFVRRIPIKEIPWRYVIFAALVDTVGFAFYNIAITLGELSYVSVITSSCTVVTVFLSYVFLKEKLNRIQLFGFLFSLAGIILLQLK
ncbi:DMT family transporter [Candidatus Roizmanbacteria bacterium]|nr:DMT family transporter [Candidatus Roizmanbacteria bacterium]